MSVLEESLSYDEALQFIKDELLTEDQKLIPHLAECILEAVAKDGKFKDHKFSEKTDTTTDVNLIEKLPYYEKIKDNKPREDFNSKLEEIPEEDLKHNEIKTAFKEF
jgi:hypothetical protein